MKRVFIQAYINFNLGDDLFIKILCERYPKCKFYLFTPKEYSKSSIFRINNLYFVKYGSIYRYLNKIYRKFSKSNSLGEDVFLKFSECVVNIGGSIFMEKSKSNNKEFLRRIRQLRLNKNYFVLGANFGPYKTKEFKEKYYDFFSKCRDVCFRDKVSFDEFNKLKNVRFRKDIVFSLKVEKSLNYDYVLFSVIKPSFRNDLIGMDQYYYMKMAEVATNFVERGKKVKFISFCKAEGDESAIEEIINSIKDDCKIHVSKYFYCGDIEETLTIINNSEIIVATRFHASILGFIFEKPVFPIAYNQKTINVLNDLNFSGNYSDFNSLNTISIESIVKNKPIERIKLEKLNEDSEKQFEKLDEFLSRA